MTATPSNDAAAPMREALALAAHAVGLSDPNPRVGCVIVGADGRLAGRGHTQEAGGAHAEAMALRDAAARGVDVRGATVYVTLEPCSHHGRTPPCADALIAAGVARVVIALRDPNPLVSGAARRGSRPPASPSSGAAAARSRASSTSASFRAWSAAAPGCA
jgi:diaminohydroxyphosphoribosylaminopyrimidine deaminase/5-amino-6-(5-phosphoribosylamino)uracil reductase